MAAPTAPSIPSLYFGYGSNLWLDQMAARCPTSTYQGLARLDGYRWMINERGYANIVELATSANDVAVSHHDNVVFGLVYTLEAEDERRLDINEGVPTAYTKEYLETDFWSLKPGSAPLDTRDEPQKKMMLVYINRNMTADHVPRAEYVYRMNMGIRDAVRLGVPGEYVDRVMRKFIPDENEPDVEQVAMKQALAFQDER